MSKYKIINDPVHGFITVPDPLILQTIDHKALQRLRQIAQMGLSYLVYPGAHHTRFQHALGAMYLMQRALQVLKTKGIEISDDERLGALLAILLHDVGHGPFSHALEFAIIPDLPHELMSLHIMEKLNREWDGKLDTAIAIFRNEYPRRFLHGLISGQLDTDRLDYLQRDSFYTGVVEGRINAGRLIEMMNVKDDKLCIEEKGIYSVEKFIVSRRFMYWQVYLHKTSFMFERLLGQTLRRARDLVQAGEKIYLDPDLEYFFLKAYNRTGDDEVIERFLRLTDADIWVHLKKWTDARDPVLQFMSRSIVYRKPLRIKISTEAFATDEVEKIKQQSARLFSGNPEALDYVVLEGKMINRAYDASNEPIFILDKDGHLSEFSRHTGQAYIRALSGDTSRYYLIYPRPNT